MDSSLDEPLAITAIARIAIPNITAINTLLVEPEEELLFLDEA